MGDYGQGQTDGYDLTYMVDHHQDHTDAYGQGQTDGCDLSHVVAHYQSQTHVHNPSLVGSYGQGQVDTHHQSEIDSHQPRYTSLQYTGDVHDITKIFQSSKPIMTRGNQSPHRPRTKHSKNPRSRSKHQEE